MLDFMIDFGTYDQRRVARDEFGWGFISTAAVSDGQHPFETAVEHREYNDGAMVIVEAYDSREAAKRGHAMWLLMMTGNELPAALVDCGNSGVSRLLEALGGDEAMRFPRQPRSA